MASAAGGMGGSKRFAVKQVTRSNFASVVDEFKAHLVGCDFVAISTQKTGDSYATSSQSRPWRRLSWIDTAETAYLKARRAAESYELLQVTVCPFRLRPSKVVAFPYNFHLFPRDELNTGMPSYSFSCQTNYLLSMAQDGFDFNLCIYDGLSYLSRVQEASAKRKIGLPQVVRASANPNSSVADSVFMARTNSRLEHWLKACNGTKSSPDGSLINSLRNLLLGRESYGSRPCINIDVCSDRQVQLIVEAINRIGDNLVPIVVPDKSGAPISVRVVYASSGEDKKNLMNEIQRAEDEQNMKLRGFREIIDLVSASHKPIISYNCLQDFAFIHSKFISPLPPTLFEFMCSLRMVFCNVLDVNHLSQEIAPLRKAKNIPAALSYLKRQFFVPIELEVPFEASGSDAKSCGHDVLRITQLFAKVSYLLQYESGSQPLPGQKSNIIEQYGNFFSPSYSSSEKSEEEDSRISTFTTRKVSAGSIIFVWGFHDMSTEALRNCLQSCHFLFCEDFELKFVDRSCAAIMFSRSDGAHQLMCSMNSGDVAFSSALPGGLKVAGFDAYKMVCTLGLWEFTLADALDEVITSRDSGTLLAPAIDASEVYWHSDMLHTDDFMEARS